VYWKLLKNGGQEVKGKGEQLKGLNSPKWSTLTMGIHWDTPLNINLNINNENQDCKVGTVCAGEEGGGWKKEIKVLVYGWWTSYTYMKQN
jgi:hypothetical protein